MRAEKQVARNNCHSEPLESTKALQLAGMPLASSLFSMIARHFASFSLSMTYMPPYDESTTTTLCQHNHQNPSLDGPHTRVSGDWMKMGPGESNMPS